MKNFRLTGKVYEVNPSFYSWDKAHEFPYYKAITKVELGTYQFNNIYEADAFFKANYRFLLDGGAIVEVDENGCPIPCDNGGSFIIYAEKSAGDNG
jgi:hypothetical protein